jgi:hypothetical protein
VRACNNARAEIIAESFAQLKLNTLGSDETHFPENSFGIFFVLGPEPGFSLQVLAPYALLQMLRAFRFNPWPRIISKKT